MTVIHIVMFEVYIIFPLSMVLPVHFADNFLQFKPEIGKEKVEEVCFHVVPG